MTQSTRPATPITVLMWSMERSKESHSGVTGLQSKKTDYFPSFSPSPLPPSRVSLPVTP